MLTRDDETLADAREVYASIADDRRAATSAARTSACPRGAPGPARPTSRPTATRPHLEVVSETEEATLASARAAAEIGPDYLIGGTLIEPVQEIIAGTGHQVLPLRRAGSSGHPCLLRGSIAEIADDARRAEALGVDGINLLAYRYDGDVDALVEAVVDGDDAAGDRRRVGRLGRADPGARAARRVGVHDRDRGARRRARPGRAARPAAALRARRRRS